MGHSKNRGRRRLTLPLPLRAKMIGLAMFVGGFMGLITSAQLDPISAHVERVIDGDTIQVRVEGKSRKSIRPRSSNCRIALSTTGECAGGWDWSPGLERSLRAKVRLTFQGAASTAQKC